jgi:hypothetical protein
MIRWVYPGTLRRYGSGSDASTDSAGARWTAVVLAQIPVVNIELPPADLLIIITMGWCKPRGDIVRNPFRRKTQGEWAGESGYCNCLLVTMARMRIAKVELSTDEPLPSLEELASTRPKTLEWIRAQSFQYNQLDRVTIIRMLAELADISPGEKRFTGILEVEDCVGDDGPVVQRAFALQLGLRGQSVVLAIAQEGLRAA